LVTTVILIEIKIIGEAILNHGNPVSQMEHPVKLYIVYVMAAAREPVIFMARCAALYCR
jgi:hypothetical protein